MIVLGVVTWCAWIWFCYCLGIYCQAAVEYVKKTKNRRFVGRCELERIYTVILRERNEAWEEWRKGDYLAFIVELGDVWHGVMQYVQYVFIILAGVEHWDVREWIFAWVLIGIVSPISTVKSAYRWKRWGCLRNHSKTGRCDCAR